MAAGYARHRDPLGALRIFREMRSRSVPPNEFSFPTALSACASSETHVLGIQLHGSVIRSGFLVNAFVSSSLVDFYTKCGELSTARKILETREEADVVGWNSLMAGFAREGRVNDALHLFDEMRRRGIKEDEFTLTALLNSLAASGLATEGKALHCAAVKVSLCDFAHVGNVLVDFYAKIGDIGEAREMFHSLKERDMVSWTSMITGCARHGQYEVGLRLFCQMRGAGVNVDHVVATGALSCCAALPALFLGQQLHANILQNGLHGFLSASNALVSMYAKSGCVDSAREIFDQMQRKDAVTWTAIIVGYAQNGRSGESLLLYRSMMEIGEKPDYVTLIGVLFACSHAGLEEDANEIFNSMEKLHGVAPGTEHFSCMVNLFCRAGDFDSVKELLARREFSPDAAVWKTVLAACRIHSSDVAASMVERAAAELFHVDPQDATAYTLLANAHAAGKRWEDARRVRRLMNSRGVRKEPGWSWMEARNSVHAFCAADVEHPRTKEIYAKIREMMERITEAGEYKADLGWALHEEGEAAELAHHSEKLAVAFGLLMMPPTRPIRVFKNLRICGDCHAAIKAVAKVYKRAVVVRDANYFHHFGVEGACSCGDFW